MQFIILVFSLQFFAVSLLASDRILSLNDQPNNLTCAHRHAIASSFTGLDDFENALQRIDWDPCCLLRESLDRIDRRRHSDNPVTGLAFGATIGAGAGIDRATYREIVLIFNDLSSFD